MILSALNVPEILLFNVQAVLKMLSRSKINQSASVNVLRAIIKTNLIVDVILLTN